jgi:hypothetical protein
MSSTYRCVEALGTAARQSVSGEEMSHRFGPTAGSHCDG